MSEFGGRLAHLDSISRPRRLLQLLRPRPVLTEKPSRKLPEAASWAAWPASSLLADVGNLPRGPPGLALSLGSSADFPAPSLERLYVNARWM